MNRTAIAIVTLVIALPGLDAPPTYAQESANYKIVESVFNAGGRPADGQTAASASFRVSLDSIGQGIAAPAFGSASFHGGAGFPATHPAPGEVLGLVFDDPTTLRWLPHVAAGSYGVYRESSGMLDGTSYGACLQDDLPSATAVEAATPDPADIWFYLITVTNLLHEEGTLGRQGSGALRPNVGPCP